MDSSQRQAGIEQFEPLEFIMAGVLHREQRNGRRYHGLEGKRIALFTGAYDYISDGVTLTLNRLVRYLEEHGINVLVFAPTTQKKPPIKHAGRLVSVPSISIPGRSDYRLALGMPRKARAELAAFAPDLVHIATPDYMGARALGWARARNIPVVTSFHTHFGAYLKHFVSYHRLYRMDFLERTVWRYARWFYPQCIHVYVPTVSIAKELRARGIRDGLRLWPRGVDTTLYNPSKRSMPWRRSLGIADDEVVISFVSRLVWEKGLYVFADVIEALHAQGVPHKSIIVGEGPARETLENRLRDTIFTGPLSGEALARAYASSDVFLFPSDTETFGNVTLEAMASGLPAVCANATGSSSLVTDGKTGLLARPGDAASFVDAVKRLAKDPALRREFSTQALARVKMFTWEDAMAGIAGYYEDLLLSPLITPPAEGDGLVPAEIDVSTPILAPTASV